MSEVPTSTGDVVVTGYLPRTGELPPSTIRYNAVHAIAGVDKVLNPEEYTVCVNALDNRGWFAYCITQKLPGRLGLTFDIPDLCSDDHEIGLLGAISLGRHYTDVPVKLLPQGELGRCHHVACEAYLKDPGKYTYVYGLALTRQEIVTDEWYVHSFLIENSTGTIFEPTTAVRDAYYGIELTYDLTLIMAKHMGVLK